MKVMLGSLKYSPIFLGTYHVYDHPHQSKPNYCQLGFDAKGKEAIFWRVHREDLEKYGKTDLHYDPAK